MARPGEDPNPIELAWQDPPGHTRQVSSIYGDAIEAVRKKPGAWCRIRIFERDNRAYSARVSLKKILAYDSRWEVTVARVGGEPHDSPRRGVWLRYRTPDQMKDTPSRRHLRD